VTKGQEGNARTLEGCGPRSEQTGGARAPRRIGKRNGTPPLVSNKRTIREQHTRRERKRKEKRHSG